jgi:predicted GTPase
LFRIHRFASRELMPCLSAQYERQDYAGNRSQHPDQQTGVPVPLPALFAVGTLQTVYDTHPHIGPVLPACGYSDEQVCDLVETIRIAAPDFIVDTSPARLPQLTVLPAPCVRVRDRFQQLDGPDLLPLVLTKVAAWTA